MDSDIIVWLASRIKELQMHTEFTLEFGVDIPNKQAFATFVQACRIAAQELSTQAMLLSSSGDAPNISFTVSSNEIGTKKLKIFNGGE